MRCGRAGLLLAGASTVALTACSSDGVRAPTSSAFSTSSRALPSGAFEKAPGSAAPSPGDSLTVTGGGSEGPVPPTPRVMPTSPSPQAASGPPTPATGDAASPSSEQSRTSSTRAGCTTARLRITEGGISGSAGHSGVVVIFTNTGATCVLGGYPGADGVTADGRIAVHAKPGSTV